MVKTRYMQCLAGVVPFKLNGASVSQRQLWTVKAMNIPMARSRSGTLAWDPARTGFERWFIGLGAWRGRNRWLRRGEGVGGLKTVDVVETSFGKNVWVPGVMSGFPFKGRAIRVIPDTMSLTSPFGAKNRWMFLWYMPFAHFALTTNDIFKVVWRGDHDSSLKTATSKLTQLRTDVLVLEKESSYHSISTNDREGLRWSWSKLGISQLRTRILFDDAQLPTTHRNSWRPETILTQNINRKPSLNTCIEAALR